MTRAEDALAEALDSLCWDNDGNPAPVHAIIAALPPDVAIIETAKVAQLRFALSFHNQTMTGVVRTCLPYCIACAALAETSDV